MTEHTIRTTVTEYGRSRGRYGLPRIAEVKYAAKRTWDYTNPFEGLAPDLETAARMADAGIDRVGIVWPSHPGIPGSEFNITELTAMTGLKAHGEVERVSAGD